MSELLRSNGRVLTMGTGIAKVRAHPSAPNGVDLGESVLVYSDEGGNRFVSLTLPVADYSAYPKLHLIWHGGAGLGWSTTVAPVSGITQLGPEAVVLGPCAGVVPRYEVCPEDSSGRIGYSSGIKQATLSSAPAITSVSIDGSGFTGAVHTAVVQTLGPGSIVLAYQWKLSGVNVGTASTYTPGAAGSLTVTVTATSEYGVATATSDPVDIVVATFAVPGLVDFTTDTGGSSGEIDITIGADLPDAGDGAVVGDGSATITLLEYSIDGGVAATLDLTPTGGETITITTTPGATVVVGVRAVSDFPRVGEWAYQTATAAGSVVGTAPVYTGGLVDLESEVGTAVVKTWSAYFTGATSYTVNTGVTGPVSTGTGNVTYSGTLTTAQDVTFSVTATNSVGSTTRTFRWRVVTPKVMPSIKSAFPDVFTVKIGSAIDYDATQHFNGTDLVYTSTISSPMAVSSVGRLKNSSALSSLISPYTFTITATNSLGFVTSANITFGVVVDPPAALTTAGVGVTTSVDRYTNYRTPRMFPPRLQLLSLGSNPATMTNASASVTVAATDHTIEVGQQFALDLDASRGVTLTGTFTADSVSAGVSVTFTAGQSATSSGTGGGTGKTLRPLFAGIRWSRTPPDTNGNIASDKIETATDYIGAGEYQLLMTDPAKRGNPSTQSPRTDYSVFGGESGTTFYISHRVIPGQDWSAWSAAISVPLVIPPEASSEWLPVSPRPKESYQNVPPYVGNQGQQFQRCRTWNQGIIDPDKRGWVISQQDENSCRLCKNGHAVSTGNPALWGFPRLDGAFGSKSGGLYLNTDDNGGAGLFIMVAGAYDGAGFGTSQNFLAAGVYIGDGTLNWAKKLTITRPSGPGPTSGANKLAWTKGNSANFNNGDPDYFGNTFDRRGNFVARRPQIRAMRECTVFKTTAALLNADLAYASGTKACVYADATAGNNAVYTKSGASGSGSWTKGTALRTDAQRPIYIVEQHGSKGARNISYQALFKSTDGGTSFTFVRELPIATFANGQAGIYDVLVSHNGTLVLTGVMGAFRSTDEGASFTRIYGRAVTAAHFYGGDYNSASGLRVADEGANANGGVWFVANADTAAATTGSGDFAKTGTSGLPSNYNVWDMAVAPSNENRILINSDGNKGGNPSQGNATDAYLSTNGGSTWANVTSTALPGPSSEQFRWGLGGKVAGGHAGFLFCPTDEQQVVAWTNQTVSHSINGGSAFKAEQAAFFDGMHNKGTGFGPISGTDPWKKMLTVSQDSLAATWLDGTNWAQRCGLSTGNDAFRTALQNAGAGDKDYVSGSCGVILPNNNVICAANRNVPSLLNVMCILTNRQSDGSYPLADVTVKNLSSKTTRAGVSAWSLKEPASRCFIGRWSITNVTAAAGSISFTDVGGHEFVDQLLDGTTLYSYWAGSGANPSTVYRSTADDGSTGQGSAWVTTKSDFWYRNICIDPFNKDRILYVPNSAKSTIVSVTKTGSATPVETTVVDLKTLITADFAARIPGGTTLPEASYTDIATLVSDPNMDGLFYAIVGVHGVPNVWMTVDDGATWKNVAENLPRTLWFASIHPLTGDLLLDSSMGRHILPPPEGYPAVTYRGALSSQLSGFYDAANCQPPTF